MTLDEFGKYIGFVNEKTEELIEKSDGNPDKLLYLASIEFSKEPADIKQSYI